MVEKEGKKERKNNALISSRDASRVGKTLTRGGKKEKKKKKGREMKSFRVVLCCSKILTRLPITRNDYERKGAVLSYY